MTGSTPPRLVVRTLAATFLTSTLVLVVVFVVLSVEVQRSVRRSVTEALAIGQSVLSASEQRRSEELVGTARALAESPTLKAALDTYQSEREFGTPSEDLSATIRQAVERTAERVDADVVAVLDRRGVTLSSGGPLREMWASGVRLELPEGAIAASERVVRLPGGAIRAVAVPLDLDVARVGWLVVGSRLDRAFAERLADLAHARIAIVSDAAIVASSLPDGVEAALASQTPGALEAEGILNLEGEAYAYRRILALGDAGVYALGSIDAAARPATRDALETVAGLGLLALLLSAAASFWLARSITGPIGDLSAAVEAMATARDLETRLQPSGSSRELDALTKTFNALLDALAAADAETRASSVAAIRSLAVALDARDPYTAGHSERVSVLSVAIGRRMGLPDADLEVLRVGALLHDIGKIGVPDAVLQKRAALTPEERAVIRTHATLSARILRTLPFLAAHVPIAELHHERPDGRGYPYGLTADAIPMPARIVHVADAYDAMTTARAYRDGWTSAAAISELWRGAGCEFDVEVVRALVASVPEVHGTDTSAGQLARPAAVDGPAAAEEERRRAG